MGSIVKYTPIFRENVIDLWEASVRATHLFLTEKDISYYRTLVDQIDFEVFDLFCYIKDRNLLGFLGVSNEKIEMLFVHPQYFNMGIGTRLLQYGITKLKARYVDVNEENHFAIQFYIKAGFEIFDRSPLDDQGQPHPILKLRLLQNSEY